MQQEKASPVDRRPVGGPKRNPVPEAEEQPEASAPVNVRCGVCLFNAVNRIFLPCGNNFCSDCVLIYTRNYPYPQCRTPFLRAIVFLALIVLKKINHLITIQKIKKLSQPMITGQNILSFQSHIQPHC